MKKKRLSIQDLGDLSKISKFGHAHTKPYIVYVRIGVLDRQTIKLPPDSQVVGALGYLGEIYLKIQVTPKHSEATVTRYFYAFNDGQYMLYPNLASIGSIALGGSIWFVFEDDMFPVSGDI